MSEFSNEFSAMPDGFSAVSTEELEQIEGGFFYEFVKEALRQVVQRDVGVEAPMLPR